MNRVQMFRPKQFGGLGNILSSALGNVANSVVGQVGQRLTNSIGSVVGGTQTGQITASVYDLNTASLCYDQSTDKESFLNCLVTPK